VFTVDNDKPGHTPLIKCEIITSTKRPIYQNPYRVPPAQRVVIKQHIATMLENDIIEESTSPWASPVLLVPKKNGKLRFCIDYRKLNAITRRDVFPLPRIDDTLEALKGNLYFSTVDAVWGYWNVPMDEQSKEKTAFITPDGLFQFRRMPFGLTNAPAIFSRLMSAILAGLSWQCCLVYLDDIIIFSRTYEDHLRDLQLVFDRLLKSGLKLNGEKCDFFRTEVAYLGHVISEEGISCDPKKIEAIQKWNEGKPPTNLTELRSFLGMAGYYRRFVRTYAHLSLPLTELLAKDARWDWTPDRQAAFEHLKRSLAHPVTLAMPDFTKVFYLTTDASIKGISAILSQVDETELAKKRKDPTKRVKVPLTPIAFASRKLTPAERNYETAEQEALALVWGTDQFRYYLLGNPFVAQTDNGALTWLMTNQKPGRLSRWALRLSEFNYTIEHIPGVTNPADGPSRFPARPASDTTSSLAPPGYDLHMVDSVNTPLQTALSSVHALTADDVRSTISSMPKSLYSLWSSQLNFQLHEITRLHRPQPQIADSNTGAFGSIAWREKQLSDPVIKVYIEFLESGIVPDNLRNNRQTTKLKFKGQRPLYGGTKAIPCTLEGLQMATQSMQMIDSVLHLTSKSTLPIRRFDRRIVVPKSMIIQVLDRHHNDPRLGAHMGRDKTQRRIQSQYYWERMNLDIESYVKACIHCQKRKPPQPHFQGLMQPIDLEDLEPTPFYLTQIDLAGPMPTTLSGNQYILVMVCHFTKYKLAVPIKDATANTVCEALYRHLILPFGPPTILISDQGSEFISQVTARLAERLGINHRFSSAYHHQTSGEAERFIKWLKDVISIYISSRNLTHREWDKNYLQEVIHCYNRAVHPTTNVTPYYLMFGHDHKEPLMLTSGFEREVDWDVRQFNFTYLKDLQVARNLVLKRMREQALMRKQRYDEHHVDVEFIEGSLVLVWQPPSYKLGEAEKLQERWTGPWKVIGSKILNSTNKPVTYELLAQFSKGRTSNGVTTMFAHVSRIRPFTFEFHLADAIKTHAPTIISSDAKRALTRSD
jgi:hypothetical protein